MKPSSTEDAVENEVWINHPLIPYQAPPCRVPGSDTYANTAGDTEQEERCKVPT